MTGRDITGRAAGQQHKGRAQSFTAASTSISHVPFDRGIKGASLLLNPLLYGIEVGIDQLECGLDFGGRQRTVGGLCEKFHKLTMVRVSVLVNVAHRRRPLMKRPLRAMSFAKLQFLLVRVR